VTREAACACGHRFDVADELAGGITNCPQCGRAVAVPGLRDPFWRVLQGAAAVLWAVATAVAAVEGGALAAVVTAVVVAGLLWLVSRAF